MIHPLSGKAHDNHPKVQTQRSNIAAEYSFIGKTFRDKRDPETRALGTDKILRAFRYMYVCPVILFRKYVYLLLKFALFYDVVVVRNSKPQPCFKIFITNGKK